MTATTVGVIPAGVSHQPALHQLLAVIPQCLSNVVDNICISYLCVVKLNVMGGRVSSRKLMYRSPSHSYNSMTSTHCNNV